MTPELKILNEALGASRSASDADKRAALKASMDLRGEPFVFNGYLLLVARGVARTESNIRSEAKKIAQANEAHFADQRKSVVVGEGELCL